MSPASLGQRLRAWVRAGSLDAMHQLLLLRHAKSSWDDRTLSDHARPLNVRGRRAAGAVRRAMTDLGIAPDVVLVSSSRRTLQTVEALEPWADTPLIEPLDSLYLADPGAILTALQGLTETVRSAMVVGHNPGLHELAVQLVGPGEMTFEDTNVRRLMQGYPSGALTEFTVVGPWRDLEPSKSRLVRFICPRDLPEMTA